MAPSGRLIWKNPLALDHQVERVVGLLECALRKDDGVGGGPGAESELQPAGNGGLRTRRRARLQEALVQQVLKLRRGAP